MGWLRLALSRLNGLVRRRSVETDIDEDAAEFEAATEFIRITDEH